MTSVTPFTPGTLDLEPLYIGLPYTLPLTWWTDDTKTTAKNLNGWTAKWRLVDSPKINANTLLSLTHSGADRIVIASSAVSPNVTISIRDATTTALKRNSNAYHYLTLIDTGGVEWPWLVGSVNITYWGAP